MKFVLALIAVIGAVLANPVEEFDLKTIDGQLKLAYDILDSNDDGKVDKAEFLKVLMAGDKSEPKDGLDEEELGKVLEGVKPDIVKRLFKEFNNVEKTNDGDNKDERITEEELTSDFLEFDIDDDLELTRLEWIEAVVLGFIFDDIESDTDKDNQISQAEWIAFFDNIEKEHGDKIPGLSYLEVLTGLKQYPVKVVDKFFDELDDDDDGDSSKIELILNLRAFDDDQVATLGDDQVDVEEFRWSVSTGVDGQIFETLDHVDDKKNELTAEEIISAMDGLVDGKKDGKVSIDEARKALDGIPEESIVDFFDELNTDNDEHIELEEATAFVKLNDQPKITEPQSLNWLEFDAAIDA